MIYVRTCSHTLNNVRVVVSDMSKEHERHTLFGASALQSFELQRSLGDAAVRDSTLESMI